MSSLLAELTEALGTTGVITDRHDLERYEQDGRGSAGRALAVLRPSYEQQVASVVRIANSHGASLVPQGARTGLSGSSLPNDGGQALVLSLERLRAPPRIDAANRTATVQAGVLLSQLNAAAAEHGLCFPIDLGADPSVGGMIAANTGGARFLRHGDVRRAVLGLEVVLVDQEATHVSLGRALWKNNVGLDLKQLFIGASGATGIITSATLALQPLSTSRVTALIGLATPEAALDLLLFAEARFGMLLTAFEGISAQALALAYAHVPRLRDPFPDAPPSYAVLIELASGPVLDAEALETALAQALCEQMEHPGSAILDVVLDHGERLWAIRHAVPEGLRAAGHVLACDVAVRRGDVMRLRQRVTNEIAIRWPDLLVCDFGHIGDGGLHLNLVLPKAHGPISDDLAKAVRQLVFSRVIDDFEGSFSAEHGIGPRNLAAYHQYTSEAVRGLAGAIQTVIAPMPVGRVDFGLIDPEKISIR